MDAYVFCGGEIRDYSFYKKTDFDGCLVICADGGYRHACALGVVPDVIIGDGDSIGGLDTENIKVIKYPPEKDYTDTNLCIDYAIEQGCKSICLLGALGGRRDQEFSHICLLAYGLAKGVRIRISDKGNEIWMEDKPFSVKKGRAKYISFFPYGGDVENFSVSGLKYSAEGVLLCCDRVTASSNRFDTDGIAKVSFDKGKVLVMLCDDKEWL